MGLFFVIFGLLFLASLATIVFFYVHAWPRLTLLDVHKIPEVRESQKKDEILRRRAAERETEREPKVLVTHIWLVDFFKRQQAKFRSYVDSVERKMVEYRRSRHPVIPLTDEEKRARRRQVKTLLHEAETALTAGAYDSAEKDFIAVISLDEKNAAAYQGLGDVYFAEKQFTEAKQTYRYALHLDKNNEHAIVRLAEIAEAEGALETAVEYYQQAVLMNDSVSPRFYKLYELLTELGQPQTALAAIQEALALEPQNPKYLDNFIEASIMVGNKNLAEEGYQRLRMVNPENQKLSAFKERIDAIS